MYKFINILMVVLLLSPATGISGGAINFDGLEDYVDGDMDNINITGVNLTGGRYTVSMWVKSTTTIQSSYLLDCSVGRFVIAWQSASTGGGSLKLGYYDGSWHEFGVNAYTDGAWHHMAWVFDLTTAKLYVDGAQFGAAQSFNGKSIAGYVRIGSRYNGTQCGMGGAISEVLLYNVVLPLNTITYMFACRGAWYPKDGLQHRYSMDNNGIDTGQPHPNGSSIKDSIGSNDGIINDGADNSMTLVPSPVRKKRGRR